MAIFSISLRLLIPLKGVLKRVPLGRISLAMLFFYNGLVPFTLLLFQQLMTGISPGHGAATLPALTDRGKLAWFFLTTIRNNHIYWPGVSTACVKTFIGIGGASIKKNS